MNPSARLFVAPPASSPRGAGAAPSPLTRRSKTEVHKERKAREELGIIVAALEPVLVVAKVQEDLCTLQSGRVDCSDLVRELTAVGLGHTAALVELLAACILLGNVPPHPSPLKGFALGDQQPGPGTALGSQASSRMLEDHLAGAATTGPLRLDTRTETRIGRGAATAGASAPLSPAERLRREQQQRARAARSGRQGSGRGNSPRGVQFGQLPDVSPSPTNKSKASPSPKRKKPSPLAANKRLGVADDGMQVVASPRDGGVQRLPDSPETSVHKHLAPLDTRDPDSVVQESRALMRKASLTTRIANAGEFAENVGDWTERSKERESSDVFLELEADEVEEVEVEAKEEEQEQEAKGEEQEQEQKQEQEQQEQERKARDQQLLIPTVRHASNFGLSTLDKLMSSDGISTVLPPTSPGAMPGDPLLERRCAQLRQEGPEGELKAQELEKSAAVRAAAAAIGVQMQKRRTRRLDSDEEGYDDEMRAAAALLSDEDSETETDTSDDDYYDDEDHDHFQLDEDLEKPETHAFAPAPPDDLQCRAGIESESMICTWTAADPHGSPVLFYTLTWLNTLDRADKGTLEVPAPLLEAEVERLTPGASYRCSVVATNARGSSRSCPASTRNVRVQWRKRFPTPESLPGPVPPSVWNEYDSGVVDIRDDLVVVRPRVVARVQRHVPGVFRGLQPRQFLVEAYRQEADGHLHEVGGLPLDDCEFTPADYSRAVAVRGLASALGLRRRDVTVVTSELASGGVRPSTTHPDGVREEIRRAVVDLRVRRLPAAEETTFRTQSSDGKVQRCWEWMTMRELRRRRCERLVHTSQLVKNRQQQNNSTPCADVRAREKLTDGIDEIVAGLFAGCSQVNYFVLQGGFSGDYVLQAQSLDKNGRAQEPTVCKVGPASDVDASLDISRFMTSVLGRHAPMLLAGPVRANGLAGIKYELAGARWLMPELVGADAVAGTKLINTFKDIVAWEAEWRALGLGEDEVDADDSRPFGEIIPVLSDMFGSVLAATTLSRAEQDDSVDLFQLYSIRRYLDSYVFPRKNVPSEIVEFFLAFEDAVATARSSRESVLFFSVAPWVGPCHGDLNGANVLVDSESFLWFIDFVKSEERGHVLKDLVKLESCILFEYTVLPVTLADVCSANGEQLRNWLGVSRETARAILAGGPFDSIEELLGLEEICEADRRRLLERVQSPALVKRAIEAALVITDSLAAIRDLRQSLPRFQFDSPRLQFTWDLVYLLHKRHLPTYCMGNSFCPHLLHVGLVNYSVRVLGFRDVSPSQRQWAMLAAVKFAATLLESLLPHSTSGGPAPLPTGVLARRLALANNRELMMMVDKYSADCQVRFQSIVDALSRKKLDIMNQTVTLQAVRFEDRVRQGSDTLDEEDVRVMQATRLGYGPHLRSRHHHHETFRAEDLLDGELTGLKLIIVGAAASGKTSLLHKLIIQHRAAGRFSEKVPLYISVAELGRFLRRSISPPELETADLLDWYLSERFSEHTNEYNMFSSLRQRGSLLVLVDGLDEAGGMREHMEAWVERLSQEDGMQLVVTTRHSPWLEGFKMVRLLPLGLDQQVGVAEARIGNELAREAFVETLHEGRFAYVACNPMILSMMIALHELGGSHGESLRDVDVYLAAVMTMVSRVARDDHASVTDAQLLTLLQRVAFHHHSLQQREIRFSSMVEMLRALPADERDGYRTAWNLLQASVRDGAVPVLVCVEGMPAGTDDDFAECVLLFAHMTFQEFLAARFLVDRIVQEAGGLKAPPAARARAMEATLLEPSTKLLEQIWWQQPLLFVGSLLPEPFFQTFVQVLEANDDHTGSNAALLQRMPRARAQTPLKSNGRRDSTDGGSRLRSVKAYVYCFTHPSTDMRSAAVVELANAQPDLLQAIVEALAAGDGDGLQWWEVVRRMEGIAALCSLSGLADDLITDELLVAWLDHLRSAEPEGHGADSSLLVAAGVASDAVDGLDASHPGVQRCVIRVITQLELQQRQPVIEFLLSGLRATHDVSRMLRLVTLLGATATDAVLLRAVELLACSSTTEEAVGVLLRAPELPEAVTEGVLGLLEGEQSDGCKTAAVRVLTAVPLTPEEQERLHAALGAPATTPVAALVGAYASSKLLNPPMLAGAMSRLHTVGLDLLLVWGCHRQLSEHLLAVSAEEESESVRQRLLATLPGDVETMPREWFQASPHLATLLSHLERYRDVRALSLVVRCRLCRSAATVVALVAYLLASTDPPLSLVEEALELAQERHPLLLRQLLLLVPPCTWMYRLLTVLHIRQASVLQAAVLAAAEDVEAARYVALFNGIESVRGVLREHGALDLLSRSDLLELGTTSALLRLEPSKVPLDKVIQCLLEAESDEDQHDALRLVARVPPGDLTEEAIDLLESRAAFWILMRCPQYGEQRLRAAVDALYMRNPERAVASVRDEAGMRHADLLLCAPLREDAMEVLCSPGCDRHDLDVDAALVVGQPATLLSLQLVDKYFVDGAEVTFWLERAALDKHAAPEVRSRAAELLLGRENLPCAMLARVVQAMETEPAVGEGFLHALEHCVRLADNAAAAGFIRQLKKKQTRRHAFVFVLHWLRVSRAADVKSWQMPESLSVLVSRLVQEGVMEGVVLQKELRVGNVSLGLGDAAGSQQLFVRDDLLATRPQPRRTLEARTVAELRAAAADARDGDTLALHPGVYELSEPLVLGASVHLVAADGVGARSNLAALRVMAASAQAAGSSGVSLALGEGCAGPLLVCAARSVTVMNIELRVANAQPMAVDVDPETLEPRRPAKRSLVLVSFGDALLHMCALRGGPETTAVVVCGGASLDSQLCELGHALIGYRVCGRARLELGLARVVGCAKHCVRVTEGGRASVTKSYLYDCGGVGVSVKTGAVAVTDCVFSRLQLAVSSDPAPPASRRGSSVSAASLVSSSAASVEDEAEVIQKRNETIVPAMRPASLYGQEYSTSYD